MEFGTIPWPKDQRKRKFKTIIEKHIPQMELAINLLGQEYFLVNVDAHYYHDMWYAFVLYEEVEKSG